jgi:predicted GNAT family acetyltransferase
MEIKLKLNDKRQGSFYIEEENELVAEMVIRVEGPHLTIYHTEVAEKAEGKGYAKLLLNEMVDYARKHQLKVMPLCPFVHAQFKRQPANYADLWK